MKFSPVRMDEKPVMKMPSAVGMTFVVDEAYIRESIVNPGAKISAGYQPIMPTFQGQVTEEGLLELIEYVKALKTLPQVDAR